MGVQWVSIVLKNDVGFHFPCCRAILGVQGGTDTMLMRLDDARTHGIQVKLPAENIMINFLLKVAGMWIQDWSGKIVTDFGTRVFWNWRWNETWYPNLDTVIRWNLAFLETK